MNPIDRILSVIAPHTCIGCGREGAPLCFECCQAISILPSICYSCGKATRAHMACERCVAKYHPHHVWIHTTYSGTAKDALKELKFKQRRAMARPVAAMLSDALPFFAEAPLVCFVPTATSHRRERGFDHAELLARELCKLRSWHYMRLVHRTSQVRQLGSSRQARKQQLKNVFTVATVGIIKNQHIVLVDDVITTGATVEECAKVLYKAGARQVDVVAFARTP